MIEEYPHSLFGRLKRVSFNGDSVFPLYFATLLDDAIVEAGMSVEPLLDIRCRGELRVTWQNPAVRFYANVVEDHFEMRKIVVVCGSQIEGFDRQVAKSAFYDSYDHDRAGDAAKDIVHFMRRTLVLGGIKNT